MIYCKKVIYILTYVLIWVLARIQRHHVIKVCNSLRIWGLDDDMRVKRHVIPLSREIEFDWAIEIARQWDEEDLTPPKHVHSFG